ncbi:hypothetical protein PoB_006229700 [Plakobranchus ocellatus]|uniref:FMR1-interacting protein 1 conserved domain-containing protein n=1 Tax=Plakobranchus ocellatus TaxID=259542 RepID=A0AAV4CV58_9GAST|nr:hypothetical protein PoB_006229700 [Plakobranchus ocellatus]
MFYANINTSLCEEKKKAKEKKKKKEEEKEEEEEEVEVVVDEERRGRRKRSYLQQVASENMSMDEKARIEQWLSIRVAALNTRSQGNANAAINDE